MNRRLVWLLIPISVLLILITGLMKQKSNAIEEETLIGEWENPELGSVEVQYWDDQKTRILVNGLSPQGPLNFAGAFTVITSQHLRIQDESIRAPYELHLEWSLGELELYIVDGENDAIPPEFRLRFPQFHGNGSFDLPESPSPFGLGGLNEHGLAMLNSLARNEGEPWDNWIKRLKTIVPELVLSEPASVENPEHYPQDLVDFWRVCGHMELGMFPIVHSPHVLDERTESFHTHYSKPVVMINDTDGWGYCLSRDSSKPFLISWDHEVDFEVSEELPGTLSDIIAQRIAEVATVYPPFDLTYNKLFRHTRPIPPSD